METGTKLQVNVSGYSGEPCTVLAIIDEDGVFFVDMIKHKTKRVNDEVLMITYSPSSSNGDIAFNDKDLYKSISCAFDLYSRKMVHFLESIKNSNQLDPRTRVQLGKVTETGKDYQLSSEITNSQIAFLCVAWAHNIVDAQNSIADFASEIDEMQDYFMTI